MKVMLAFYGGGHVTAAIPLIRELRGRGHEVVPLALTAAAAVMAREGLPHRTITDYVDPADPVIRRYGEMLLARHHTDGKGITVEQSIAYLGTGLADLAAEVGEEEALARYREKGLNAFMPLRTARRILETERPDRVLATASPRMEAAMMRTAVELGIPSICMVDLFAILELPWLRHPGHGHWLTVHSQKTADRLVAAGRRADRIAVTGYPAFDSLADPGLAQRARAWRERKGFAPGEKVVLWADQPEPANPEFPRSIRSTLQQVCAANGWRLVVRLHPASSDPQVEKIPQGAVQSFADERLPEVAAGCDAVCTCTSTVAMESLLLDKPVLILKGSQYDDLVDYSDRDGALVIDSPAGLESALATLLEDTPAARRLAAARATLPVAGRASRNIADVVEQLEETTTAGAQAFPAQRFSYSHRKNLSDNMKIKVSDVHDAHVASEFDRLTALDIQRLLSDRTKFVDTGCPACHSLGVAKAFAHQGLDYRRCIECETLYISPAPTEEMHLNYVVNSAAMKFWREQMPESMRSSRVVLYRDRREFAQEAFARLGIEPKSSIEIGAGNGEFAEELAQHTDIEDIVLLEPQDLQVSRRNIRVIKAGFEAMSGLETQFDVAFGFELIEHLLEPDVFLGLVHRALKPGAPLMLSTPNEKSVETRTLERRSSNIIFDHVRLYNPRSIRILLERNGFRIVSLTTPGKLDVERLSAAYAKDPAYFDKVPALKFILNETPDRLEAFQSFLVREFQSSHMRIVAVKDGEWRGSPTPHLIPLPE